MRRRFLSHRTKFGRWATSTTSLKEGTGSCFRKHAYVTEAEAEQKREERQGKGSPPLRIYRCQICSFWHLTKHPLEAVSHG